MSDHNKLHALAGFLPIALIASILVAIVLIGVWLF